MKRIFLLPVFVFSSVLLPAQKQGKYLREIDQHTRQTWVQAPGMQQVTIDSIPCLNAAIDLPEQYYSLTRYFDSTGTRLITANKNHFNGTAYFFKKGELVFIIHMTGPRNEYATSMSISIPVQTSYFYLKNGKGLDVKTHHPEWHRIEQEKKLDSLHLFAFMDDLDHYQDLLARTSFSKKQKDTVTWTPEPGVQEWPAEISWEKLEGAHWWVKAEHLAGLVAQPAWLIQNTLDTKTYPVEGPYGHGRTTTVYYLRHKNVFYLYSDCIQGHIDRYDGPYEGNPKEVLAKPTVNTLPDIKN